MHHRAFQDQLALLPVNTANILQQLIHQNGRLEPKQVNKLKGLIDLSSDHFLKVVLPLAAAMSISPISNFPVGAIVEGFRPEGQGPIYLGANLEMAGQPLKMAIHAEQAAISNAWHQGESRLRLLMVNEAPCGHCRQFMNEINQIEQVDILVSPLDSNQQRQYSIANLLPNAFGPEDLKQSTRLMSSSKLSFESPDPADKLVNAATEAAQMSYAPYSGCHSGIALLIDNGDIITGRYAENAAFNPGMTAVEAALVNLRLSSLAKGQGKIVDAVLVEKQATISHKGMTASIISHMEAELRYFVVSTYL